jgi:hypothetical protein
MSETDAFFTQTIVGAPMSVLLGRQLRRSGEHASEGLRIDLAGGTEVLSPSWRSWIITTQACAPVGIPRMRPGRGRRWLERHALVIAAAGLLGLLATALFWGLTPWI